MLCTAPTLRTAAIGCRLQPSFLTPCAFSTNSPPLRKPETSSPSTPQRRYHLGKRNVQFKTSNSNSISIRYASTASPTNPPSRTVDSSSQTPAMLDWNTFFKLRKTRRWYQLASSIGGSATGFVLGAQVLTRADMDAVVSQIPLDPFITLGLITFTCGGVGWLSGPVIGTSVFNWRNRKFRGQMDAKEKEFYRRIKKFRVDPSNSSMANPVPDYYGEKIASVAGYRQWLKDQRAFNRKRTTYVRH